MNNNPKNKEEKKEPKKINKVLQYKKNLKIINQEAGQGSFGKVVIAEDITKKTQYAIKIIKIDDGLCEVSDEKLEEAKAEADFLKKQNHPNIVKYVDQFQIGINYFIVMEKCEKNLQQVINEFQKNTSFISKEQFVSYACQTLSAIKHLHEQKCMLRDLSLNNILVDSFNQIKLCDFGLVKKVQEEENSKRFLTSQAKGAWLYQPPELLANMNGGKVIQNFNGDIWAFGVCFFRLSGGNIDMQKYFTKEQFLNHDQQQLDQNLNKILLQILNYDPNQRPQSIEEIQLQFEKIKKEIWTAEQADTLYKQYLEKKNSNQLSDAFQFITVCCQILEKNDIFLFQQGYIQSQLKMFDAAIKSYQSCLEINPNQYICYYNLGNAYAEIGLFDEAIKYYEKWIYFNPQDGLGKYNLGNAYYDNKKFRQAIPIYLQFLQIHSQHYNCNLNLGSAYYKIGDMDNAKRQYDYCLTLKPNDDSSFICHYNLGNIFYKQGRYQEAIKEQKQCQNLESFLIKNNKSDEIIQTYKQCLQSSYYNLGSSFKKISNHLESINYYKKCLEIDQNHENANKQLQKLAQQNIKC